MIFVVHRRQLALCAGGLVFLILFSSILFGGSAAVSRMGTITETETLYVIDPGHGGEDGGAVAEDGTVESQINLCIAKRLEALLFFLGRDTHMVRTEDVSIYTEGAATLREKKVSDIHNRVDLVNGFPDAVLLSIHQNSLPQAKSVHGAQAFFNGKDSGEALAAAIQQTLNETVNRERPKESKAIDSSVYLMKHIECPGVLVECGFLSNVQETALLKTPAHQTVLALSIASGVLNWESGGTQEIELPITKEGTT